MCVLIDHDSSRFFYRTERVVRSSQGSPLASVAAGFLNRILLVSDSRAMIPDAKLSYLTTVCMCVGLWCVSVLASANTARSYLKSEHWNTVHCSSPSLCHLSLMSIYYSVHLLHPPNFSLSVSQDYNRLSASCL